MSFNAQYSANLKSMVQNTQLQLASEFVQFTDKNIFLTGKAGTGKTTFLHQLKKISPKRMAIVAPTGVAAINAGGVTIHSFFQMPFGPYISESIVSAGDKNQQRIQQHHKKFGKEKINLIRSLDLLVIDEISMVRADTLDGIDEVLKRYKDRSKPFGGVQLLMIGDLHQLSPVVKDEDWKILKDYYENLYFFNSKALKETSPISIELKHIYRQTDTSFIDLLNKIRENNINQQVLEQLNQRYIPGFKPKDEEGYITLTTHNNTAQQINEVKLAEIKTSSYRFKATVIDDFPDYSFPTVPDLELKVNAQVMFVKNDTSRDKLFYNGKIGTVIKISKESIYVKCPDDPHEVIVNQAEWQNIKYVLNPETKEVEETVIGSFVQYPLKLAWAITIHKSQGLTFERAIIDANSSFAHGQVYVALSRCKTFEGMVLRSAIGFNSVKTDGTVASYTRDAEKNAPGETHLTISKIAFQQNLLYELFDFRQIKSVLFQCKKLAEEYHQVISLGFLENINAVRDQTETEIYAVADRFKRQLQQHLHQKELPEENIALQERIKKACAYFVEKLENVITQGLEKVSFDADNKLVKKNITEAFENIKKEIFIKQSALRLCCQGFQTLAYLKTKANAEIDFANLRKVTPEVKAEVSVVGVQYPELYKSIKTWRDNLASENNVPVYLILPQKVLIELVNKLPSNFEQLESIKGMGKMKVKQYGNELLMMIADYCEQKTISQTPFQHLITTKKEKVDTKKLSFDLYKSGKTIQEIAKERGFAISTIETHLTHYIGTGEIDIFDVIDKNKVENIRDYILEKKPTSMNDTKLAMGNEVSYSEIRAVMKYLMLDN